MKTFLVQPFRQRVVWQDPTSSGLSCLELLNEDLSFCRTEFSFRGSPEETLAKALEEKQAKPEGWVKIESDSMYEFSDLWPEAVRLLGSGRVYLSFDHSGAQP